MSVYFLAATELNDGSGVERRALSIALVSNVLLSAGLAAAGYFADSSALVANALDNASDAVVYAISIFGINRGLLVKVRAAQFSGLVLLLLSGGVVADVVRRFQYGSEPVSGAIMGAAFAAAVINLACLQVLRGIRHGDVNVRAAWTFSVNDFASNGGALLAGGLVAVLGRSWPDLAIGLIIAAVVAKGGVEILVDARRSAKGENK